MAIQFFDDQPVKSALEKALSVMYGPEQEVALINVNLKVTEHTLRTHNAGLDIAIEKVRAGIPVVLHSFLNENMLIGDQRFVVLMSLGNVIFIEDPGNLPEYIKACEQAIKAEYIDDPLGFAILDLEKTKNVVGILQHDLRHALRDQNRMSDWLKKARAEGFAGSDQEIIETVQNWIKVSSRPFAGQYFPGLFVDIEDTLLNDDETLNVKVGRMVEELSPGRPVTIWTGGDIGKLEPKLRSLGIRRKVVSKYNLAGTEVEEVIDDLPQAIFEEMYEIKARIYHQIT